MKDSIREIKEHGSDKKRRQVIANEKIYMIVAKENGKKRKIIITIPTSLLHCHSTNKKVNFLYLHQDALSLILSYAGGVSERDVAVGGEGSCQGYFVEEEEACGVTCYLPSMQQVAQYLQCPTDDALSSFPGKGNLQPVHPLMWCGDTARSRYHGDRIVIQQDELHD